MTRDDVKTVLGTAYKPLALCALSYVNLTDREMNTLIMRFMRGLTQEQAAEQMDCSVNGLKNWEYSGLTKCVKAWENLIFIEEILRLAQN